MNSAADGPNQDRSHEGPSGEGLTREQYLKIRELFPLAADLPPDRRRKFLREAFENDERLVREVESLVAADEKAGSFLERPALEQLARNLATERLRGMLGKQLGRYRIEQLLGVGGAGEVYLAEDATLKRKVAIKVLFRKYLEDRSVLRRFQHEAMAASALNHPNILTIYEIGEIDGFQFIVTEFIEGTTLRRRLNDEGLPLRELGDIALQISRALGTAHACGIIHLDLKPENVMVRTDGLVKVLDFGLAKLMSGREFETGESEPGPRSEMQIEGTLNYMSPEQLNGEPLDLRADIYSFGVMLYEMSSGKLPFQGEGEQEVLGAILAHKFRPLTQHRPALPMKFVGIVERAMSGSAKERYSTMEGLRQELLDGGFERRKQASPAMLERKRTSRPRWVVGTVLVLLTALILLWSWRQNEEPTGIIGRLSEATFEQITSNPALDLYPAFSPDGRTLVYASNRTGNWDIYLQPIGENTLVDLTTDCAFDDRQPAVSPDGAWIAFRSERDGGGIFLMTNEGENVRRLTKEGHNPAWSPDGAEIAYTIAESLDPSERGAFPSALYRIRVADGRKRRITQSDAVQAAWSPDGSRIAYWGIQAGGQRDIWTIPAEGGEPEPLTHDAAIDWGPVWSPDGRFLYFTSDRSGSMNLWRLRVDERSGKALGLPEAVTLPATASWYICFSRDGRRLAYVQTSTRTNIAEIQFDESTGQVVGAMNWLTRGNIETTNPDVSSDGDAVVFDSIGERQEDLYVLHDGSGARRITDDAYKDRAPRWEPNSDRILFFSDRSGRYELWTIKSDGTDLQPMPRTKGPGAQMGVWSPDGTSIVSNRQSGAPLLLSRASTGRGWQSRELPEPPARDDLINSWSPDGQHLAGFGMGIFKFSFETGRYETLTNFGQRPVWLSDSRRLLFCSRGRLYLLDSDTGKRHEVLSVDPLELQSLSLSHDRRRLYLSIEGREADIWMARLDD